MLTWCDHSGYWIVSKKARYWIATPTRHYSSLVDRMRMYISPHSLRPTNTTDENRVSASILSSFILSSSATSQVVVPTAKIEPSRPALGDDEQTELPDMPTTEDKEDQTSKVAAISSDDPLFPWSPEYLNFSASSAANSSAIDAIREIRTKTNETKAMPADTEGPRPNSNASIQYKGANERARLRNATDDDFIAGYYKASRLHHLSLWRAQFEDELNSYLMSISHSDLQQQRDVAKPNQTAKSLNENDDLNDDEEGEADANSNDPNVEKRSPSEATRLIMHIDMARSLFQHYWRWCKSYPLL